MKYVAFLKPGALDGLDWVYNLMEDKNRDYDFYLIDAKDPKEARKIAIDELYKKAIRNGGTEYVVEDAFFALAGLVEAEDEEVFQALGHKDGKIALEFFEKYTRDAFLMDKVRLYDDLTGEDVDKFYAFDKENLESLYKQGIWYDVLVMPITRDLTARK